MPRQSLATRDPGRHHLLSLVRPPKPAPALTGWESGVCNWDSGTAALHALLTTKRTDQLDGTLPAHRRGTLRGMDAA
ncbi:hypothetical protein CPBF367_41940 [Xanthomonas arboricola pv. juglandis]|nr:hypothetical protein CPBF367_41940 [Xanthomonas arboricola pv. juglandis]